MTVLRIMTLLALSCLLASCSNDHHHDSSAEPYTQAIFPGGISDATAISYEEDGVTPAQTLSLEISYNDKGNIAAQQWQRTAGDVIFSAEETLYNSSGAPEQITGLQDEDDDQSPDYTYTIFNSYDADNNLASQYHSYTPTDAETPESIRTTSYRYDTTGNLIQETSYILGDDTITKGTQENTYNEAGQLLSAVLSIDNDDDQSIDSLYETTYEYDDQGRLTAKRENNEANAWPDTTTIYTCNTDNRIEQTVLTSLGMFDPSKKIQVIRQYEYLDNGYPATISYEYSETDLEDVMERNISIVTTFSYDESQRITSMQVDHMDLMTDTLDSHQEWTFTYSDDDTQVTLQVMEYLDTTGEGILTNSGTLNMVQSGLFSQLYHNENEAGAYSLLPLPVAVANEEFFENTY